MNCDDLELNVYDPVVLENIVQFIDEIKQQRKEIIRQEDEEDNKYRRKIVK